MHHITTNNVNCLFKITELEKRLPFQTISDVLLNEKFASVSMQIKKAMPHFLRYLVWRGESRIVLRRGCTTQK